MNVKNTMKIPFKLDITQGISDTKLTFLNNAQYNPSNKLHTLSVSLTKRKKMKDISAVPEEKLFNWSFRLFALMNLSWDYVDTILDQCINMRIDETKRLCRKIKELKREYDQFRWGNMLKEREVEEQEIGLSFEEMCSKDFKLLAFNLNIEIDKFGLDTEYKLLVISVQQALTLIDAVKIYAQRCDNEMHNMGVWTCDYSMVQNEFLRMAELIPQFAGDCYQPGLAIRKQTALILANRLNDLPIPKKYLEKENSNDTRKNYRRYQGMGVCLGCLLVLM